MAFTVEDGTGVAGANAYCTVAWADAYHAERGETAWTGVQAVKEQAIVRATDYIEVRYRDYFLGTPEFTDPPQPLSFPRLALRDRYGAEVLGIPADLMKATAEYALRALTASLLPDPVVNPAGIVVGVREKVGPIETETTFNNFRQAPVIRSYPVADRLLAQYVLGAGRGRLYR